MYRLHDEAILFLPPETVEAEALQQIENTSSMGFIFQHVAVMPDGHYGKGATVGTVIFGTPGRTRALEVQRINCHHNFTQVETHYGERVWITRKGAIEARRGMWATIPG